MKRVKFKNLLLPALLLGSPALASSIRSNSRRMSKKVIAISGDKAKELENIEKKEKFNDPFGVFGEIKTHTYQKEEISDVLSFLENENLLEASVEVKSHISYDRKDFSSLLLSCASGATYNGASITQITCSNAGWNILLHGATGQRASQVPTQACHAGSTARIWPAWKTACTSPAADTTPPTLSGLNSKNITTTTADINASSNEDGKIYYVITSSSTAPNATQVRSGLDNTGATAIDSNNASVTKNTEKIFNLTGLSAVTKYYYHMVAVDAADNNSTVSSGNFTTLADSDGKVTSSNGIDESSPIYIPTTAKNQSSSIPIFDFNISDGGTSDGVDLNVTELRVDVSGTNASKLEYLLDNATSGSNQGHDLDSNITGTYSNGAVTFNLTNHYIIVADGTSETYVVRAFFSDTSSITDGNAITLSIDGDSNVTVDSAGTQMATGQSAITNSSNAKMDVTATDVNFTTEPAGSVSGTAFTTQPKVSAIDAYGNVDTNWSGTVTLSLAGGSGTLGGTLTGTLASGAYTFSDVNYTATSDNEDFNLTATSSMGSFSTTSTTLTSNIVATKLIFTTQPSPTTVQSGVAKSFTTVPVVKAVDSNNTIDTDFSSNITLFKNQTNGTSTNFEMNATSDSDSNISAVTMSATSGVATFSGLQVGYTGISGDTFTLEANATNLTHANSDTINVTAAPAAPSNILATVINGNDINLTWKDNSSNESNFSIYVSFNSGSSYDFNKTVNANIETYYYSNLALDSNYSFMVTASNSDGDTNASIADSNITTPTAPTNLSAIDVNSTQINLSWSDNSSNESGFRIYSSTNGTSYDLNTTLAINTTEYNVTKLDENTTYYFKVGAYTSGGENNASSANQKTNDIPNITTLNSFALNEDFGTDSSLVITTINDSDNDEINLSVESNDTSIFTFTKSWGEANITSGNYNSELNITLTSEANKSGVVELNVSAYDGKEYNTQIFNVTITPVNDTPTIDVNSTLTLQEAKSATITNSYLSSSDVDNNTTLTYTIVTAPTNGTLYKTSTQTELNATVNTTFTQADINNSDINYTNNGTIGSDYFEFNVSDQSGAYTSNARFSITVTEINDPATYDINMTDINISEGFSDFNISLLNINDPENRDLNITVESNDSSMLSFTKSWGDLNVTNATYSNDLNFTISPYTNAYGKVELNVTVSDGVNKTVKELNITISPSPDNPIISTISNISKDINFSDFNVSINAYDPDRGDVNLTVDINDSSLIDYNTTWYDSSNEYNVTYSETCESNSTFANCYYKDLNLTIKSKPNVDGIVKVTIKAEDNVSGEITKTFDINVSADNLVLADLNALSVTSPTTTNLTLASLGSLYNSTITWVSNNTAVITNSGGVTQGSSDTVVTLTASANILHSTFSKTFSVTVTGTGDTGGGDTGGYTYVPPTNPTPEPTSAPINEDAIIVIDENTNGGNVNENVVLINEVDTKTQIETYNDFSDNGDGTNSAKVELKDTNGQVVTTEIKTEIPKENVTITTVEGGVETKANVDNSDGTKTETTSKVNTNGTVVNKVKLTNADGTESTSQVSSTKVGTNVEIAKDGSLTTSFKDNHGMEVKAVASTDGSVHHEVDTTNSKGEIVKTIAKSNVKGSQIVIKEDGTVQTSAHTTSTITNTDGSESSVDVLVVVEGKVDGKASHIMQVKDENGNSTITKAESQIDGAETIISADGGVETTAKSGNSELKVQASPNGKATHTVLIKDSSGNEVTTEATSEIKGAKTVITNTGVETTATTQVSTTNNNGETIQEEVQLKVQASSDGKATHTMSIKDSSGNEVTTEATSEIKGAKTTIKDSGEVETSATITDNNNNQVNYKVVAKTNGEATHEVDIVNSATGEKVVTEATSKIKGAKTTIKESGKVQTEATKEVNGVIVKAIVDTNENGKSFSYFKRFDAQSGASLDEQDTIKQGEFEAGNKAIIKEENGQLKLDVTSKVTKEIIF